MKEKIMINKIITKVGLVICALFLAGCDENPMLEPKMMLDLESEVTQNSSLKDRVLCVEYGTNPSAFSMRQPFCSNWMQNQYKGYVAKISTEMATANIGSNKSNIAIPTYENFTDPQVWQILWSEDGEKWKQELIAQNTVPVKAPVITKSTKCSKNCETTVTIKKRVPKQQIQRAKTICELYPQSLACQRIKRAIIREAIINNS